MPEPRKHLPLLHELHAKHRPRLAAPVGERLQRVVYAKARVRHLVHLAHAAAPDAAHDAVQANHLPVLEYRHFIHHFSPLTLCSE